jgi:signal peptidase I
VFGDKNPEKPHRYVGDLRLCAQSLSNSGLTDVVLARLADPKRGDIVTFSSPTDGTRLIKRIVALPGDTVEMRDEVLIVNGHAANYALLEKTTEPLGDNQTTTAFRFEEKTAQGQRRVQWLSGVRARDNFGPVTLPKDQFLMLGDNRDNSADSRYFGFVPRQLLIGQAVGILVSADIKGDWLPRFARFGTRLD